MTIQRKHPWRGMHWLLLAAAMSALMNHASGVALWAIQRHRAARAGLD